MDELQNEIAEMVCDRCNEIAEVFTDKERIKDICNDIAGDIATLLPQCISVEAVCCFVREEFGNMNFESDEEVIEYVMSFLPQPPKDKP